MPKAGGAVQELHERIHQLSPMETRQKCKEKVGTTTLELIMTDPAFNLSLEDLKEAMEPSAMLDVLQSR